MTTTPSVKSVSEQFRFGAGLPVAPVGRELPKVLAMLLRRSHPLASMPPPITPLPRALGTSLHRQLFLVLRDEIQNGVYAVTGALPKEEALCERFGVSRITVRRALADLAALGVVERRHGLGTFVRGGATPERTSPSLSLVDSLRRTALETEVKVLHVEHELPPPAIAALLQIEPGVKAMHALRLRAIDGAPVMVTDAWVPAALARKVTVAALKRRPLYEILLDEGVRFGRVVQEITAAIADPTRAAWLQVEVGGPLLKMVRLLHDPQAKPVQHLTVYLPPERSRILMDIPGESVNTLSAGQIVHDVPPSGKRRRFHESNAASAMGTREPRSASLERKSKGSA